MTVYTPAYNWEISHKSSCLPLKVDIEMELDSGADCSTVPWALFKQKLAGVCKLAPTKAGAAELTQSCGGTIN